MIDYETFTLAEYETFSVADYETFTIVEQAGDAGDGGQDIVANSFDEVDANDLKDNVVASFFLANGQPKKGLLNADGSVKKGLLDDNGNLEQTLFK